MKNKDTFISPLEDFAFKQIFGEKRSYMEESHAKTPRRREHKKEFYHKLHKRTQTFSPIFLLPLLIIILLRSKII